MNSHSLAVPSAGSADFTLFAATPGLHILLSPDAPQFTTLAVSNDFLRSAGMAREEVIGKGYFSVFSHWSAAPNAASVQALRSSFDYVLTHKNAHELTVQGQGKPVSEETSQVKNWKIRNVPLLTSEDQVQYIIHSVVEATEQQKVQLALGTTIELEKVYDLFMQAPIIIGILKGDDYLIELANDSILQVWGRTRDVIGKPLLAAIPEMKDQGYIELLDQTRKTGVPYYAYSSPIRFLRNGKEDILYFDFVYQPYYDYPGQPVAAGVIGVGHEVTEQVLARQKVADSEAILRAVIESAPFPIAIYTGPQMQIQLANRAIMEVWGKGFDVIGKSYKAVLPELENQLIFTQVEEVLTTGTAFHARHQRVDILVDGLLQPYYFNYSFTPLFDQHGAVYGVMNTAAEVTDLIVAQQRLEASESRYRQLSAELEQQVRERTQELSTTNEQLWAANEELAATNEEYVAINEELAATTQQLTESNELLLRSNENLQRFAYVASHDLQEPLRKIQQFGDLLKTRYGTTDEQELDYLKRMQAAASRMSVLIRDLLDFSRISTRRESSELVALDKVVQTVLNDLELVIEETGANVVVDPLPSVVGDSTQLGQLFSNLLSNALKFRRSGVTPSIHIRASQVLVEELPNQVKPGQSALAYHRIEIADNGIGFEEKYLDRMFEVFQRLHGQGHYTGTGIGLAICEKVVANHGGAITAHSQLDQGSTFEVYLPI